MKKNYALSFLKKHQLLPIKQITLLSILNIIISILTLSFAYLSKLTIDAATNGNKDDFLFFGIILISIIVFEIIILSINHFLKYYFKNKLIKNLKSFFYNQITHIKAKEIRQFSIGDLSSRIKSDIEIIGHGLIEIIPKTLYLITRFLIAVGLLVIVLPMFSILFILLGIVLLLSAYFIGKVSKKRHLDVQKSEAISQNFVIESIEHIDTMKVFESEDYYNTTYNNLIKRDLKLKNKRNAVQLLSFIGTQTFYAIGYAFAMVFGAYQLLKNPDTFTFGDLTLLIQLVQNIQSPLSGFSGVINEYHQMISSTSRIMELFNYDMIVKNAKSNFEFDEIKIESLTFSYGDKLVLDNINLTIKKNERVLLKGISGIGKTTFSKLLLNLEKPSNGSIKLIYGNKSEFLCHDHLALFSYVPQSNFFHSGKIIDLITMGKAVDKDIIDNILEICCLKNEIDNLPHGLNTYLNINGSGLSIGQLQRLAIARALIKDSPVIIFDELTSQLDLETEKKLINNINVLKNKTLIFISHRALDETIFDQIITF